MKVAIVTQPLMDNYGCLLQNYALQQALKQLGHEPVTIDFIPLLPFRKYVRNTLRVFFRGATYLPLFQKRREPFDSFVRSHIATIPGGRKYRRRILDKYGIEAIVVGSDQVWRQIYNLKTIPDMFLGFARNFKGPRVAYAASFGIDSWDVPEKHWPFLARLAKRFTSVSVRESSGIRICRECLGVDAVQMPDPVFLLPAGSYLDICRGVAVKDEDYLAAYILDKDPETEAMIEEKAAAKGLEVRYFTSGKDATLPVEEWLAYFCDASYVITDSFHGSVFAKMFGRPCEVIRNPKRGGSRFDYLDKGVDFNDLRESGLAFLKDAFSGKTDKR